MELKQSKLTLYQPACYRIAVQGTVDTNWSDYFGGLTLTHNASALPGGVTILSGEMCDQAMLLGVLNRLYNLGLPLVLVEQLAPRDGATKTQQKGGSTRTSGPR